jgi:ribose 5-phosphate isomerase B
MGVGALVHSGVVARIALGSDHAGYELKQHFVGLLSAKGHQIIDHGTDSTDTVDYPPFCAAAGRSVRDGLADVGIVVGGSGQGEQLAANKVRGVRAALCNDLFTARLARAHNDANVLSIGARVVGVGLAEEILAVFLATSFDGGRHAQRVAQITELEEQF